MATRHIKKSYAIQHNSFFNLILLYQIILLQLLELHQKELLQEPPYGVEL